MEIVRVNRFLQIHRASIIYSLLIIFAMPFFCPSAGLSASLSGNAAAIDLTPPLEMNVALGGYGARMSQPARGVHDRIWAKALVLTDGEKKYAVVAMDVLGLPPNVKPLVLQKLVDESWAAENLMLLPSHSHASLDMTALNDKNILNSPQIGIFQPELLDFVIGKLAHVIDKASTNLQPVKVGTGSVMVDDMNRNRRRDEAVDRELTLLRVDRFDGTPLAVLVNWSAHPTFLDENDMLVSAGWPGALQQTLEEKIGQGVIAMYYNGAQGDQSPIAQGGADNYQRAEIYGRRMGDQAMQLYQAITPASNDLFKYNYQLINLPNRIAHPLFKQTGGDEYGIDDKTMEMILNILSPGEVGIGALRIGDFAIVGAPGELGCQLGLDIKKILRANGIAHPTIGGLANEWISYIMSAEQYENAGYETSVSFYGPQLGEIIVKSMLDIAGPLAE